MRQRAPRPPTFPQTCNITYAPQQAFYWYYRFLEDNAPCLTDFAECIAVNASAECYSPCMTDAGDLANACGLGQAVYCNVDGDSAGVAGHPPFEFHSATCVPSACDEGYHDQLLASIQYAVCRDSFWTPGYCSSIGLTCAYQLKTSSVWKVVGIAVGSFLGLLLLCVALYCWYRCKHQRRSGSDAASADSSSDDGESDAGALLLRHQQAQFDHWEASRGGSVNDTRGPPRANPPEAGPGDPTRDPLDQGTYTMVDHRSPRR
jgi:hypothetical protein